jgi:hypothetical protein
MSFVQNPPLVSQGMFTIDQNSTPEQLARKRAMISAMMPRYGSARYVGEGLGQLAHGIMTGVQNRKMDKIETAGREGATASLAGLLGGNAAGPLTILGIPPQDPMSPNAIGADAMAAIGKDPAGTIRQGLIDRGMPAHVADGFVMNFQDESGLNPGINEQNPTVAGSRGGFGLAQWTGPRRKALEAFAAQRGAPVSDTNVQLDFLMTELQGPESAAWQKIAGTNDAGQAGAAIVNNFLRPAEQHRAQRAAEYTGGNTALPQIPSEQLISLMANPWLAPEQRQMLETMLNAQTQAGDPKRQIELQQAQLNLDQDRTGGGQDMPASFQAMDMQAQAAGLVKGSPEYQEFMRNGGSSGQPAAFIALDMQAQAAGFKPGTPEYQEFMGTRGAGLIAGAKVLGEAAATAEAAAPADIATADRTLDYIKEVRDHPGRVMGTGASSVFNFIPGTSGRDFDNRTKQLTSGAFLTAIDEMRGMGSLSNTEGQTATAAITRLDTSTSEGEFLEALADYERIVTLGRKRALARQKAPADTPIAPANKATTQIDGYTIEAVE